MWMTERPTEHATEPVVLPFAARRGWREADVARRAFAILCPVLVLGWVASLPLSWERLDAAGDGLGFQLALAIFTAVVFFGGPPACYSAARILRPHPAGTGGERQVRHWCAAIATAYGVALLTWISGLERGLTPIGFGAEWTYIAAASSLGPVTVVWGLVVAAQRACAR